MQGAPEVEAGRRAVVARDEVGCVDGLESRVGEAAEGNGLALTGSDLGRGRRRRRGRR